MKNITHFLAYSFRGRIIAGVVLLHAFLMGLVVVDMVIRQQNFMEQQVSGESRTLAYTLALNAPSWLLSNDVRALGELVDSLKAAKRVQLAIIMDRDGIVRASTDPSLFNLVLTDPASTRLRAALQSEHKDGRRHAQLIHDNLVDSLSEITSHGSPIGYARVIVDRTPIQAELDTVVHKGIALTLLAILIGGLIAWALVHSMTRRLKLLSQAANTLAGGNLKVSLPDSHDKDEVGQLTRDFNAMSSALSKDLAIRMKMEAMLFAEKESAQVTLSSIGDAVITTDIEGRIQFMNPVAETLTGWSNQEALQKPLPEVFKIINEFTREPLENPVEKALRSNCAIDLSNHTILIRPDGSESHIEDNAAPIRDRLGSVIGVVLVFHDVTEKHTLTHQLSFQATHDGLTGLYNRQEFERRLGIMIGNASALNLEHALIYLDLDQFKVINDTCGHSAGDELLRQLTVLLQKNVRDSDTLSRLGGDEFGLLLYNCQQEKAISIANQLLATIQAFRFAWEDKMFTIGASIGLVMVNRESGNVAHLLSAADTACYAAKDKGRNRIQVFSINDSELAQRHGEMNWVGRISKAFEEDRFLLYYQPIVPLQRSQGDEQHFEILIRMRGENNQLIPPADFIPAAEHYNLMTTVDRWVVSHAFNWLVASSNRQSCCAINLSGQSLGDENFLDFVVEQIHGTKLQPQHVCFEITETAAITNFSSALHFINEIKNLGCRFSLDDFGSGMSSYAYLKTLPVDYLKIDGSFVKDIIDDPIDLAMVEAINNIGHVMDIQTIAEFVENDAILEKLRYIGVDYAQGFGIAKPKPLEVHLA